MSTTPPGAGNCNPQKSQLGADGRCYAYCPEGWSPIDNGPFCAQNCPPGYLPTTTGLSSQSCLRPSFQREVKPMIQCPAGSDRLYDKCLLGCPVGTTAKFSQCVPDCPSGYVETPDGLSCQAEFFKRTATVREACYANETRIAGRYCLGPCQAGTVPLQDNSEMCYATVPPALARFFWNGGSQFKQQVGPIISKIIFARSQSNAYCNPDFVPLNGQCFAKCPTGSQALSTECLADCPTSFKSVNNQTACLSPVRRRAVVLSALETVGNIFRNVFIAIISIMLIAFVTSLL